MNEAAVHNISDSEVAVRISDQPEGGVNCRFCNTLLTHTFVDLGASPIANDLLRPRDLHAMEPFFPLRTYVCDQCHLVQLPEHQRPEQIFDDYTYFSSYSSSWLEHARGYVEMMMQRYHFGADSRVIELASNDGYLLQYFQQQGVPVLGIEPAATVARAAVKKGIPSLVRFFGVAMAKDLVADGTQADLLIGNNVLAHVPDINDFVAGMKIVLKTGGTITMEFPHLMRLVEFNQFDTIYHEHYSYLSLSTVQRIFAYHGLALFDVEELPTHGGSLRIYACHKEDSKRPITARLGELLARERAAGMRTLDYYVDYQQRVEATKRQLLKFLIEQKELGKTIAGYGAPAKGNTLLNYCGVRTDFIDFTVDRNPSKQGRFLPGVRIPVYGPEKISELQPDFLLILPWNLKDEIVAQMSHIRDWGGQFVVPIPEVEVL